MLVVSSEVTLRLANRACSDEGWLHVNELKVDLFRLPALQSQFIHLRRSIPLNLQVLNPLRLQHQLSGRVRSGGFAIADCARIAALHLRSEGGGVAAAGTFYCAAVRGHVAMQALELFIRLWMAHSELRGGTGERELAQGFQHRLAQKYAPWGAYHRARREEDLLLLAELGEHRDVCAHVKARVRLGPRLELPQHI